VHPLLECVVNLSEGRRGDVIAGIAASAGPSLLDVHSDRHHHRSVLTLGGPDVEDAVRAVSARAVEEIDITGHDGVHPRMGAVDVVPFAPIEIVAPDSRDGGHRDLSEAVRARDRFVTWAASRLELPCFVYGPERTLPELRREAFRALEPAGGPAWPHPTAGATAVGARPPLVAYNMWLVEPDLALARMIAAEVRSPHVRALGLEVGGHAQVSCNLIDPLDVGPADVYDDVARRAAVDRAELVGLVPDAVLAGVPVRRWSELDLGRERTIEARLDAAGIR
jgi:glutamate formiminotransferase / 5-formyltetrahydrofolate cyclo-ligase